MMLIPCPWCGKRDENEFVCGGTTHIVRPPSTVSDEVWGAYLLLQIGLRGSFTAAGLHEINAHGHAQIFGWVGLFVMGFAYQAFPRFKHTSLVCPHLALATFVMMLAGIARSLRFTASTASLRLVAS